MIKEFRKMIMPCKKNLILFHPVILTATALLLCSCSPPAPEPYSEYIGPEKTVETPARKQATLPTEHFDINTPQAEQGPLVINIEQAILMAMSNNQSLFVEKINPPINRTFEKEELSVFDPFLTADFTNNRVTRERLARAGSSTESSTVDSITGGVSLEKLFPTGTLLELDASTTYTDSSLYSDTFTENRLGFTVTQALLQGLDIRANLARVNQARIDTLISQYELRGFTELLLEQVESKFWDYVLAQKQIEIYTDSLTLAEQQRSEIQERINIGNLAETELAAAQAEVALRRESLINARSNLAKERLNLLKLLNPSRNIDWDANIILEYDTTLPDVSLDSVEQHILLALKMRPELNQAKLQIKRGDLDVVQTKNGLLPRLDAFITFGKTGYADSFSRASNRIDRDNYDAAWGIIFADTSLNRRPRARYNRAVLSKYQLRDALENLIQLVQVDVRIAYIEVNRTREQITATAATRAFQEETLRVETEKFRVGKSTSLLVAQAQRDLVASRIAETEAVVNYLKALIDLYRLEGSLLQRRGIVAPGIAPVALDTVE